MVHLTVHFPNAERCRATANSPPNTAELEKQQVPHRLKTESLMQEVPTRWNNTLEMVKCLQINQEPLRDALDLHKTNITMPTNAELEKLQRLEALLELCSLYPVQCCCLHYAICLG
ncbi:hypothetical protein N1851_018470 [Merluccius polli]|uniref:Uncharacterized protein n=1 Tax=Merluccius polli TaxID=89951 RepID=A0AA47MN77_MERPO|nr:hypothetical protein N1851_018470 [Merluccius polli]